MKMDRRGLLRAFGIGAAAVASGDSAKGVELETVRLDDPPPPLQPSSVAWPPYGKGEWLDVVRMPLYSAREFHIGEAPVGDQDFFGYAIGSCAHFALRKSTATTADTNMLRANTLPAANSFMIERVGVLFAPSCHPEDIAAICNNFAACVRIGDKSYFRAPVAAMFGVGEIDPHKPAQLPIVGFASLAPLPLMLESFLSFQVVLEGATHHQMHEGSKVWVVLDGLHARPVQ